ncbi:MULTISPECIES: ParM/StbA family protein [Cyanophyceae]|uniref:ParM/StbA family protein n=1 Tax=Cyanophyceae TaxID=3028117 RepID=UPI00016DCE0B|nr:MULTISPECIES: ParM/StbA family protein [Cyanophyceae]ACB00876.1 conserved hypothetical protein [Picosynechococcus sp. PCC 7002]SMH58876.1 hypothetical protein SAMN06272755_3264 [Picosynechococcus sp. OG1]SMH59039.1 hypothetical protein SAMN06272755_3298 [Picosynechococcus sp. OG1]SMQ86534.1 hypothetical protein SAMN06272774_3292 [Synechococcus sp. 7002]
MSKLKIVIDPGSSATKVVYQREGDSIQCFTMAPYCAAVPPDYPKSAGWGMNYTHVENAWISHKEACYLLGASAKKFQGSAIRNNDLKYIKALYKILGVLCHVQTLIQETLPIDLGILLPFDEYVTKDRLEEGLVAAQETVLYCGRSLSLDLNEITICPEGAGLFLQGLPRKINPQLARVAVLVIGHRNTSWLVTDKGYPSVMESVTNNLGFRWLVQEVQKRTGHKDEIALAEMIFTGKNLRPELQQEIKKCLPLYWQQIRLFLTEQNPVDYVVCGGGAAMLLEQEIMGHLSGKVSWANHLARGVVKSGIKDRVMARRLVDSYGLLHSL